MRNRIGYRNGFTLIELMIVITVILALISLTASASLKLIEVQQVANTQTVLNRAQSVLVKNWSAVKDYASKETIENNTTSSLHDTYGWIYNNFCRGIDDANAVGRVRVIYIKLKMRQAFPMNFTEALYPPFGYFDHLGNPNPGVCPCSQLQPLGGYRAYLNSRGISLSNGFSWESSACLLMALQRGIGGTTIDPDKLTAGGAGGVDNGFNVPVLNDAWGRPIYFSRVPVGCPTLNPSTLYSTATVLVSGGTCYSMASSNPLGVSDSGDPQGYLQSPIWKASKYAGLLQSDTLELIAPSGYFYMTGPMIGSGGPGKDKQSAFDPITFAPFPGSYPLFGQ